MFTLISCGMIDGALEADIHGIDQPNPTQPNTRFYISIQFLLL